MLETNNATSITTKNHISIKKILIVVLFISFISLGIGIVYFKMYKSVSFNKELPPSKTTSQISSSDFFDTQNASVIGKVTKISTNSITVENSKQKSNTFKLSQQFSVMRLPTQDNPLATPSANIKDIKLNQEAMINLIYTNNEYQVASISYLTSTNLPAIPNGSTFPNSSASTLKAPPLPKTTATSNLKAPPQPITTATPTSKK